MKYFPFSRALSKFFESVPYFEGHPYLRVLAACGIIAFIVYIVERLLRRPASSRSSEGQPRPTEHGSYSEIDVDAIKCAVDEVPSAHWYVRTVSGEQFGPADGRTILQWMADERVTKGVHVWREGWIAWRLFED